MIVIVICICCYSLESLSAVNHCHNDLLKPVTALLPGKLKVTCTFFCPTCDPKTHLLAPTHARFISNFFAAYCSFILCCVKGCIYPKMNMLPSFTHHNVILYDDLYNCAFKTNKILPTLFHVIELQNDKND